MRANDFNVLFDLYGGVYVTDTIGRSGRWAGVKATTTSMISSLSCTKLTGTLTGIQIAQGDFLPFPGDATFVQMTSGNVIILNA